MSEQEPISAFQVISQGNRQIFFGKPGQQRPGFSLRAGVIGVEVTVHGSDSPAHSVDDITSIFFRHRSMHQVDAFTGQDLCGVQAPGIFEQVNHRGAGAAGGKPTADVNVLRVFYLPVDQPVAPYPVGENLAGIIHVGIVHAERLPEILAQVIPVWLPGGTFNHGSEQVIAIARVVVLSPRFGDKVKVRKDG